MGLYCCLKIAIVTVEKAIKLGYEGFACVLTDRFNDDNRILGFILLSGCSLETKDASRLGL